MTKNPYNPDSLKLTVLTPAEFRKLLKRATPITVERLKLTPELAQIILDANELNRDTSPATVDTYAQAILRGGYQYLGSSGGMGFNSDGHTENGGNRSAALVKIAQAAPDAFIVIDVTFGLKPGVRKVMDSGRQRTNTDLVQMLGFPRKVAAKMAAVSRYIAVQCNNGHRQKVLADDIESVIRDFSVGFTVIEDLVAPLTDVEFAAAFVVAAQAHPEKVGTLAKAFGDGKAGTLVNGTRLHKYMGSPISEKNAKRGPARADTKFRKVLDGLVGYITDEERNHLRDNKENFQGLARAIARLKKPKTAGALSRYVAFLEKSNEKVA